jgi:hypothetical protein
MMSDNKCLATVRLCLIGLLVGPMFAQQTATQPLSDNANGQSTGSKDLRADC